MPFASLLGIMEWMVPFPVEERALLKPHVRHLLHLPHLCNQQRGRGGRIGIPHKWVPPPVVLQGLCRFVHVFLLSAFCADTNPYDLGTMNNLKQVLGDNMFFWWLPTRPRQRGDGTEWQHRDTPDFERGIL